MSAPLPPTSVDLDQLEQTMSRLEQLKQFVETRCVGALPAVHESLGSVSNIDMSEVDYKFTRQATAFGGFYSAYGVQARNDGVYRAVEDSLKALISELGQAVDATRTIIGNYRRMEESNTNMAADIERRLSGQTLDGSANPHNYPGTTGPTSVG
jgi:hypothetical protein